MVMTILEAVVQEQHWDALEERFRQSASPLPSQIEKSYLVKSASDPSLCRIVTVWKSREALQEYKELVETPEGVVMFRSVDAEPTLTSFDVRVVVQS